MTSDRFRSRPNLEVVVGGRSAVPKKAAKTQDGPKSVRVGGRTHQRWRVFAAIKGMTLEEALEWLLDQHPVDAEEVRKALSGR